MFNSKFSLTNHSKRYLLENAPWILRFLPSLRNSKFKVIFDKDRIKIIDRDSFRQIFISRSNIVYTPDIANHFDYYFSAVEPYQQNSPIGKYATVDYSSPRFHKITGFLDFPILCPSLAEPFQTCQQYLDFAQLTEGENVLDLGCYSALTAIAFSKAVGKSGRVISAEPDRENYAASLQNIELHKRINQLKNITIAPVAISGRVGELNFNSESSMGSAASEITGDYRGFQTRTPCTTLNELTIESGIDEIHFIKMDIEGSEIDAIDNSKDFFKKHRPRIIIEPHFVNGKLTSERIMKSLTDFGYKCKVIEQTGVCLPLITGTPN